MITRLRKASRLQLLPLVLGFALLVGIIVAAAGSNGVLNPAVALGIGSFSYAYLLGPVVGGALGMVLYSNLHKN